ncbi:MAG TPA: phage tail tip lysozyme [Streptosporangiaceae bacterium]|nr:phage tail tip lysozyme [Streptosporangiaceae bacterium]
MSSARASHRKSTKIRRTGRHAAPSRARRAATIVSVAVPAVALLGTCTAYYGFQHPEPDPLGSSVASYSVRALNGLAPQADADAAGRLAAPTPGASRGSRTPGSARSATPGQSASPTPTSSATPVASSTSLTCSDTGGVAGTGMLPLNYVTIVNFLVANGYTDMAAVGIAGNIYQESGGDPESIGSGGGGLIGWTPLPAGYVTGNAAADLQTQLAALLTYNQEWAQYIPMLNAATNATDAAYIYMTYFERPGIPAAANREGAAVAVAEACGFGS